MLTYLRWISILGLAVLAGCTSVASDEPPAYESSERFSVEYDEAGEVLLLSKPVRAQCFWIQMWSPDEGEWLVVASIPDNGSIVPSVDGLFTPGSSPLDDPVENPGCDDDERAPALRWTVPFTGATSGSYRVVWLSEGEYSSPVEIQ